MSATVEHGAFVTFEGGEGTGKSTQIQRLAETLRADGRDVVVTREPGGSPGAEAVRHVLLSGAAEGFGAAMEAILFAAARSDHVEQVIRPAVERGAVVLCDRYMDSTRVYQGATGDLSGDLVRSLEIVATNGMVPDLTLIFDLDPVEGLARATKRRGTGAADRFEKETVEIHQRRRQAYLDIAKAEPARCVIIDADRSIKAVAGDVAATVRGLLERPRSGRAEAVA